MQRFDIPVKAQPRMIWTKILSHPFKVSSCKIFWAARSSGISETWVFSKINNLLLPNLSYLHISHRNKSRVVYKKLIVSANSVILEERIYFLQSCRFCLMMFDNKFRGHLTNGFRRWVTGNVRNEDVRVPSDVPSTDRRINSTKQHCWNAIAKSIWFGWNGEGFAQIFELMKKWDFIHWEWGWMHSGLRWDWETRNANWGL